MNPVAGRKNAALQLVPQILETVRKLGLDYEIQMTEYPGHATKLAEKFAAENKPVWIYTCGGDGTFHEVIQVAAGNPNLAVGCIPCGSGNDYTRNFAQRSRFLDLEDQLLGTAVPLDLIETPYGVAVTICSAGLDAQVANGVDRWRRVPGCGGSIAYLLSAAQQISGPLGHHLRITLDGQVMEGNFLMIALCNGKAYGGGFVAAPQARMNDGLLDIVLVNKISRLQILPVLGAYRKGAHMEGEEVAPGFQKILQHRKAREVEIQVLGGGRKFVFTVDGECSQETRLSARILPGALQAILPGSVYREWALSGKASALKE